MQIHGIVDIVIIRCDKKYNDIAVSLLQPCGNLKPVIRGHPDIEKSHIICFRAVMQLRTVRYEIEPRIDILLRKGRANHRFDLFYISTVVITNCDLHEMPLLVDNYTI